MRLLSFILLPAVLFVILLAVSPAAAAEDADQPVNGTERELLDEELADPLLPYSLEIVVIPKAEDIIDKGYIRTPIRFNLGLPWDWETHVTFNTLINNPFRKEHASGLSDVTFGFKYRWKKQFRRHVRAATAFSVQIPTGDHPEISGEYTHFRPKLIFSKKIKIPNRRRLKLAGSIGMDILAGGPRDEQPRNTLRTAIGATYPYGNFDAVTELAWITDSIDRGSNHSYFITPGVIYHLPEERYPRLPGKWDFTVGVRFGFGDAEDNFEYITRVKVKIPLKIKVSLRGVEMKGIIQKSWPEPADEPLEKSD